MQVQVERCRGVAGHGAGHAMAFARDHRHRHAGIGHKVRQVVGVEVAVPGRGHLVARRAGSARAESPPSRLLPAAESRNGSRLAGRHPLHAAILQQAFMAGAVAMPHAPGDHVGDGLETTVRMIGKAGDVVVGLVAAKGIEHQERVEPVLQVLRQHPGQFDASAVGSGLPATNRSTVRETSTLCLSMVVFIGSSFLMQGAWQHPAGFIGCSRVGSIAAGIQTPCASAVRGNREQATHHRNVLEEQQLGHEGLVSRDGPVGVEEEAGDQRERRQNQSRDAGPKTGQQCQAAHNFHDQGDGGSEGGQRQADRRDVAHGASKAGELADAGGQEQGDHEQAGGQIEGVLK